MIVVIIVVRSHHVVELRLLGFVVIAVVIGLLVQRARDACVHAGEPAVAERQGVGGDTRKVVGRQGDVDRTFALLVRIAPVPGVLRAHEAARERVVRVDERARRGGAALFARVLGLVAQVRRHVRTGQCAARAQAGEREARELRQYAVVRANVQS